MKPGATALEYDVTFVQFNKAQRADLDGAKPEIQE